MPDAREALREKVARTLLEFMTGADGEADSRTYADALMPLFAAVWSEGADYAAVEMGLREGEFEAHGDNPYRED